MRTQIHKLYHFPPLFATFAKVYRCRTNRANDSNFRAALWCHWIAAPTPLHFLQLLEDFSIMGAWVGGLVPAPIYGRRHCHAFTALSARFRTQFFSDGTKWGGGGDEKLMASKLTHKNKTEQTIASCLLTNYFFSEHFVLFIFVYSFGGFSFQFYLSYALPSQHHLTFSSGNAFLFVCWRVCARLSTCEHTLAIPRLLLPLFSPFSTKQQQNWKKKNGKY